METKLANKKINIKLEMSGNVSETMCDIPLTKEQNIKKIQNYEGELCYFCGYFVEIHNNGSFINLFALADTANGLVDYFSSMPVIICKKESCKKINKNMAQICRREFEPFCFV